MKNDLNINVLQKHNYEKEELPNQFFFYFETLIFKVIFGAQKMWLLQKWILTRIAAYCASSQECSDRTF